MMRSLSSLFVLLLVLSTSSTASVSPNFVAVKIPKGVTLELPKNWVVISDHEKITLDSAVDSLLDLSDLPSLASGLPFAANYYNDRGEVRAMINVRYYPGLTVGQATAEEADQSEIDELDHSIHDAMQKVSLEAGFSISEWEGTRRTKSSNGLFAFVTEYQRTSSLATGDFAVRLVRVFDHSSSFTMTISYYEPQEQLLRPIADRVIASLQASSSREEKPIQGNKSELYVGFVIENAVKKIAPALLAGGILALLFGQILRKNSPVGTRIFVYLIGGSLAGLLSYSYYDIPTRSLELLEAISLLIGLIVVQAIIVVPIVALHDWWLRRRAA